MNNTPSSDNLLLGSGDVYFDLLDDAGVFQGERHLGNVESFEVTPTVTNLEKRSSMSGGRPLYKRINIDRGAEISMVLSEFASKNLALAALGIESALTQASGTATDQSVNGGQPLNFDVWYRLIKTSTHAYGVRNITLTNIKQGATTLTLNTDYRIDLESGRVMLLSSGTADSEEAITWSGSIPAITADDGLRKVQVLEATVIEGRLRFKSATDQSSGPRVDAEYYKVSISPSAAMQLISTEDFGTLTLTAAALVDITRPEGDRVGRVIYLDEQTTVPDEETA
jgi:hypothetical protein